MNAHPSSCEFRLTLGDGRAVFVRPIAPNDAPLLVDLFNRLSPQSIYLRFLSRLSGLPADMLHHFTHVDYDREFALAAVVAETGGDAVVAVSRYSHDPASGIADLAVAVRDDWQHHGLGREMLARIVAIGREHGYDRYGSMMDPDNTAIRALLHELGYRVKYTPRDGYFDVEIRFD
ncbi:MAG TPA: GNAT family N-acetyltransferase [Spirochaetota bacterium]|nr:GNAT family N-acetyltransferase [Spirochaetota bacterium]